MVDERYKIRPITTEDQDFLWDMLYEAIYVGQGKAKPMRDIIYKPELRKYVEDFGKKGDYGMIAYNSVDNVSLGAIWIRYFSTKNAGYGFLSEDIPEFSIAIHEDYRGQGIGSGLIIAFLKNLPKEIKALSLSVDPDNPAISLYKRIGFKPCGEKGTSIIMQMNIK